MGQFEAPAQATAEIAGPALQSVSGHVYFVLIAAPYFMAVILTLMLCTIWKKLHMADTNEAYSVSKQFYFAIISGFVIGCWTTYAFQELGEFLLQLPPFTTKKAITTGILVGISNPFIYDFIRTLAAKTERKWLRAVGRVLTVKPKNSKGRVQNPGDLTTMIYSDDDITEDKS